MRAKVRSVEPPEDGGGLEEFVLEPAPDADPEPAPAAPDEDGAARGRTDGSRRSPTTRAFGEPKRQEPTPVRVVDGHRISARDLGPNGDVVFDLLERARRLTRDECRKLETEAAWRWWTLSPLPGTTMPGARALALIRGRAAGRADAIVALDSAVQSVVADAAAGGRPGSRLTACVANAGLAVLVRDLVEPETFETLFGPWREVMHH